MGARDWELSVPEHARPLMLRWSLALLGHPTADWPGKLVGVDLREESVSNGVARHLLDDLGLGVVKGKIPMYEKRTLAKTQDLVLSRSRLTHFDALGISCFLRENFTIYSLVLSDNSLGDLGVAAILDWATTSQTLSHLDLHNNRVLSEISGNKPQVLLH